MKVPVKSQWNGVYLCAENARGLFASAKALARRKDYGAAVSLMVLSAEESAKSMGLFTSYAKVGDGEIDLAKLFRSHQFKQSIIGSLLFFRYLFADYFSEMLKVQSDPNLRQEDYSRIFVKRMCARYERWGKHGHRRLDDLAEWLKSADALKQRGLYVNYARGVWESPSGIRKSEFARAKKNAQLMLEIIEPFESKELTDGYISLYKESLRQIDVSPPC